MRRADSWPPNVTCELKRCICALSMLFSSALMVALTRAGSSLH
jgi:hypothetical protein